MPAWVSTLHWTVSFVLVVLGGLLTYLRSGRRVKNSVGFFHPFTSDGGGGERVLWCAVREVQAANPEAECVVYSGDDATGAELARRAEQRFGVKLERPIAVVPLRWRSLVVPERYPVLTMVGQAIGSAILTAEAVAAYRPEIFFDTVGYAFGYPVACLSGATVAAYVHYPTISTDMIARVRSRANMYNNTGAVARSGALSRLKVFYYRAFAMAYGACGRCASAVAVNSSWTQAHIAALWGGEPAVVYPPCDTAALRQMPLARGRNSSGAITGTEEEKAPEVLRGQGKEMSGGRGESSPGGGGGGVDGGAYVISVGQFRPEKDHALQLRAWAAVKKLAVAGAAGGAGLARTGTEEQDSSKRTKTAAAAAAKLAAEKVLDARLKIVGGCRGAPDKARLAALRALAAELGVADSVDWHVDVPYPKLCELLGGASAGLHTMLDEHFGICVVEYLAAGAVPIAHDSAGPRMDIVRPANGERLSVGFLATSEAEYAAMMGEVLRMDDREREAMAGRGRERSAMFSEEAFGKGLREVLSPLFGRMKAKEANRRGSAGPR